MTDPIGAAVDYQTLFNFAVVLVGSMGGWILGRLTKTLDALDRDVRALPLNYVAKADYHRDVSEMKAILQRIESKLDEKADKP
jgi:hypothetical protein